MVAASGFMAFFGILNLYAPAESVMLIFAEKNR